MKIVFLTTSLSLNDGWGRYSLEIIKHMPEIGIEPIVLTMSVQNQSPKGVKVLPYLPHYNQLGSVSSVIQCFLKIRKSFEKCYAIHCLAEPYIPLSFLLSYDTPLIISGVGTYLVKPFYDKHQLWLHKLALKKAASILCISNYTLSRLQTQLPNLNNLVVVNLGVDTEVFKPSYMNLREHGLIVSVGAIKPRKGYEYSIQAFAKLHKKHPHSKYVIVGDNHDISYLEFLKQMVQELGVQNKVVFTGSLSMTKLIDLYHRASIFMLTPVNVDGNFEGFGLVYLEAGACGLASIGSKDCGVEDAIVDGFTGYLATQADVNAISNLLNELLVDSEKRQFLGENAQHHAQNLRWQNVSKSIAGFY